jgi:hypothetical protein
MGLQREAWRAFKTAGNPARRFRSSDSSEVGRSYAGCCSRRSRCARDSARGICRDGQALVRGGGTAGPEGAVGAATDSGAIRSHDPFRAAQKHRRSPAFRCRSWLPSSPPSPPSSRLLHVRARDARNGSWVCGACVPSSVEDWLARLILDAAQACRPHRSCRTVVGSSLGCARHRSPSSASVTIRILAHSCRALGDFLWICPRCSKMS